MIPADPWLILGWAILAIVAVVVLVIYPISIWLVFRARRRAQRAFEQRRREFDEHRNDTHAGIRRGEGRFRL